MYPYRSRVRWLAFGRYAHLLQAVGHDRGLQDPTLGRRLASLRKWNLVRFGVSILLAGGVIATVLSSLAWLVPGGADDAVVDSVIAASSALTGALTLAYLVLSRLLGQLEIDILAILMLEQRRLD